MVLFAIISAQNHALLNAANYPVACPIFRRTILTDFTNSEGDRVFLSTCYLLLKADEFSADQQMEIAAAAGEILNYDGFTAWQNEWQDL